MSWLPWILLYVALGLAGLGVLAVLAWRAFQAVRELGREVERSHQRIEPKLADLEKASANMATERDREAPSVHARRSA